jgi:hypothetical protein
MKLSRVFLKNTFFGGAGLIIIYWMIESMVHVFTFHSGSFADGFLGADS